MKRFLAILLTVISMQMFAQNYPISAINITLPANPDANIANWGSGNSLLVITASSKGQNGRIDPMVIESKLLLTIKKGGNKVCGSFTGSSAPASEFNTPTKVWSGKNAVSFLGKECLLTPGDYEICVQFFGYGTTGVSPLSEEKCKPFTIQGTDNQAYQPPQALLPPNGSKILSANAGMPVTFRWTPVVPKPREPLIYRLKVWQLMQGQTGTQAIKANQPILTKDVDNLTQVVVSNLITGPCKPPYLCDFVWNVQALANDEKSVGGNNGTSELMAFNLGNPPDGSTPPALMTMGGANTEFRIDSATCLPKTNGQFNYHLWAHYQNKNSSVDNVLLNDLQSFAGYPANPNPGTELNLRNNIRLKSGTYNGALTMNDILDASSGTISNITPLPASLSTPASLAPNSIHNFQFDYSTPTNTPVQFTFYGLVDDPLKDKPNRNARNEIDSLKYPQCPCSACDQVKISAVLAGEIQDNGNGGLNFAINLSAGPKKVKRIKADLVYFDMKPDDVNCLACDKSSNTFGNFASATTSNTNFMGGVIAGHSAGFDALGNVDISNGIPVKFSLSIPPLVSCCNATITFCIRYIITFEDCTVCNALDCYTCTITGCPKK